MIVVLAHHDLAASLSAYALSLSGASVAVLWRITTGDRFAPLRARFHGRRGARTVAADDATGVDEP